MLSGILQAMEASGKRTFLIDGFPRNKDNLDGWNTAMSEVAEVKKVLFFSCSEQVSYACIFKKNEISIASQNTSCLNVYVFEDSPL